MINLKQCKIDANILAREAEMKMDAVKLAEFYRSFNDISKEYNSRYQFLSTSIDLRKIQTFDLWLSDILGIKDKLVPIIVDKMVNDGDLYFLSLYQNLFANTDYIPCVSGVHSENDLAIAVGCHWVENHERL